MVAIGLLESTPACVPGSLARKPSGVGVSAGVLMMLPCATLSQPTELTEESATVRDPATYVVKKTMT